MTEAEPEPAETAASKPRPRLLELLRRSESPLDVYELAAATGLHISTVRFHLEVLAKSKRITVRTTPRATPGRPRTVYEIAQEDTAPDGYRALAAALAAGVGGTSRTRSRRADETGRKWATTLVDRAPVAISSDAAARQITDLLDDMHFDPELAEQSPDTRDREIRLRACPYRDVAREHPDVVCSVHQGVLNGVLTQLGMPFASARLVPFVRPHLCLAYLTAPDPAQESAGNAS
ncbi:helix-turn-helix transcriptional regulator [Nakamurella sp. GG22]